MTKAEVAVSSLLISTTSGSSLFKRRHVTRMFASAGTTHAHNHRPQQKLHPESCHTYLYVYVTYTSYAFFVCVHREFSHKSVGGRILNIGPHLPKLLSNKCLPFLGHSVYIVCQKLVHQTRGDNYAWRRHHSRPQSLKQQSHQREVWRLASTILILYGRTAHSLSKVV